MSTASEPIIGIDLGTTFSLVAIADEKGPRLLRDVNGEARLPSVLGVNLTTDGTPTYTIGWEARNHAIENPQSTVYSIKRLIGKSLEEIREELPFLTYEVNSGPRDTLRVDINGRQFSPEEISSIILRSLRERAQKELNQPVSKAVITVPAYFDDAQRQATRDAAKVAGLEVLRMINEPTAAALAYGFGLRNEARVNAMRDQSTKPAISVSLPMPICHDDSPRESANEQQSESQTVAVYDLGGGTFDFSILRIEGEIFQVISTAGDTRLGGDDFDRTIIEWTRDHVRNEFDLEIESPTSRQALRGLAEAAKIRLSEHDSATIELDLGDGRTFTKTLTCDEFETAIANLVDRTLTRCDDALHDANLSANDIDRVILVGGSTRIPLIRQRVEQHFGKPPYTALNPDEVVALGAAVQASIISGQTSDMLLLDVIPLSLGLETMGGAVGKLIMRNAAIPCRATEMFTTFVDGQTAIKLNVVQGERELVEHCRSLAEFELRGIPPMPAGIPKVEVEFLVDANGILNVSATEQRSNISAQVQVVPNYGLTSDEVDRIAAESVKHAKSDIADHRRIDLVNQITFDTNKTEQMLANLRSELDENEVTRYETAIRDLRERAKSTTDLDALHRALDEFGKSTLPLAQRGIRAALTAKDS